MNPVKEISLFKLGSIPAWSLVCFIILSLLGVVLRLMVLINIPGLNYMFLLHAHSHFAFSGWIFLIISYLITVPLADENNKSSYRPIFLLTLISAFGMLISFAVQGYKLIPISFSTLFIIVNFWFSVKVWRDKKLATVYNRLSRRLIRASLVFLCLSALGPFALRAIMAAGLKGNTLYNNAIYFYLHFQMNGWMILSILGLTFNTADKGFKCADKRTAYLFGTFIWSAIPLYFIFTLWSSGNLLLRSVALTGSVLNMVSWFYLLKKALQLSGLNILVKTALTAITLKVIFQLLIGIPDVGVLVFPNRNLVIGYIHLLTLGAIMPLILAQLKSQGFIQAKQTSNIDYLFLASVVIYITLLFLQPALAYFSIRFPDYPAALFLISVVLLLTGILYTRSAWKSLSGQKQ